MMCDRQFGLQFPGFASLPGHTTELNPAAPPYTSSLTFNNPNNNTFIPSPPTLNNNQSPLTLNDLQNQLTINNHQSPLTLNNHQNSLTLNNQQSPLTLNNPNSNTSSQSNFLTNIHPASFSQVSASASPASYSPVSASASPTLNSSSPPVLLNNPSPASPGQWGGTSEKGKELAIRASQLEAMVLKIRGQYEHEIEHYKTQLCLQIESYSRLKTKAKQLKDEYKDKQTILTEQRKLREEYDELVKQMDEERRQRVSERTAKSIESKKLIMAIRAELEQQRKANIDSKSHIIASTREKEELSEKLAKVEVELSKRDVSVMNLKRDVIDVTQKYKLVQQQLVQKRYNSANLKLRIALANCEAQVRERSKLAAPERYNLTQWKLCLEDSRRKLEENTRRYEEYVTSLHDATDPDMVQFEEEPRGPPMELVAPLPLQRFDDILLGRVAPELSLHPSSLPPSINCELKTAIHSSELESIANMLEMPPDAPIPPGNQTLVPSSLPSAISPLDNCSGLEYITKQLDIATLSNSPDPPHSLPTPISLPTSPPRGRGRGRSRALLTRVGGADLSPGVRQQDFYTRAPAVTSNSASAVSDNILTHYTASQRPIRESGLHTEDAKSRAPKTSVNEVIDSTIPTWPGSGPPQGRAGDYKEVVIISERFEGEELQRQLQDIYPVLSEGDVKKYLLRLRKEKPCRGKTDLERLVEMVGAELGGKQSPRQPTPDNTCVICLESLTVGEVHVSDCAHRFHKACVELWFATRNFTCPTCRTHQQRLTVSNEVPPWSTELEEISGNY